MTARLLLQCDGTPADRPTMTLERCRAFLPARADVIGPEGVPLVEARREAAAAGWSRDDDRDLCPACARGGTP